MATIQPKTKLQELANELMNLRLENRDLEKVLYYTQDNYKKHQAAQLKLEANNKRIDEILQESLKVENE